MKTITILYKALICFTVISLICTQSKAACQADFTATVSPDSSGTVTFLNTSVFSGNYSHSWNFGDGSNSGLKDPSHIYSDSGYYEVCLIISEISATIPGCQSTYCDSIYVPIGSNHTGIKQRMSSDILLINYPNPFSTTTTINYTLTSPSNIQLEVYNMIGNRVQVIDAGVKQSGTYAEIWDAGNLSEGVYVLQLKINGNTTSHKMFITK